MPRFRGSGSLKRNGVKHRFIVTEMIGEDPLKVFDRPGKTLSLKAAFSIGRSVIIRTRECSRAYVRASTLLVGFGQGDEGKVYLMDFGLASRFTQNGKHNEYMEDLRNALPGWMATSAAMPM
ncbi:serine/threonine-protein kinase VRK1-like [Rhipicephalus sanguineus]|uniref:serine/threonine-protein kinase VRK1-like n=1 Tax=Rhipicephalus sanguineus TaxID=34632 RepID=UPI0018935C08|nr:serine/threonine-protein kinase VRK1-like [Rhipicephalus sanguineus]